MNNQFAYLIDRSFKGKTICYSIFITSEKCLPHLAGSYKLQKDVKTKESDLLK